MLISHISLSGVHSCIQESICKVFWIIYNVIRFHARTNKTTQWKRITKLHYIHLLCATQEIRWTTLCKFVVLRITTPHLLGDLSQVGGLVAGTRIKHDIPEFVLTNEIRSKLWWHSWGFSFLCFWIFKKIK